MDTTLEAIATLRRFTFGGVLCAILGQLLAVIIVWS